MEDLTCVAARCSVTKIGFHLRGVEFANLVPVNSSFKGCPLRLIVDLPLIKSPLVIKDASTVLYYGAMNNRLFKNEFLATKFSLHFLFCREKQSLSFYSKYENFELLQFILKINQIYS